jgi:hypothetical protein
MEDYLSKIVQEAAFKLEAEKERLLFQRCVERIKTNEPINFTDEAKKRFTRIKMEVNSNDNSVHYYWNDGSDEGLHLISFYSADIDCDVLNMDSNLKVGFKYR